MKRAMVSVVGVVISVAAALGGVIGSVHAQPAPVNGMRPVDLRLHAIVNGSVVTAPGKEAVKATIIIRDGVIEAIGAGVTVPAEARVWDAAGLTIYPAFIDAALLIPMGDAPTGAGAHWNNRVHSQVNMADKPAPETALRKEMRSLGFAAAAVYPAAGIMRGSGVVLALAEDNDKVLAYQQRAAMAVGLEAGGFGFRSGYPGSLMGVIALIRQTFYDAQWYQAAQRVWEAHPAGNETPARADALAALADAVSGKQVVLFDVSSEVSAIRAARIVKEFDLKAMLLGSGTEFRRLDEVVATGLPIILPVRYPERPDVAATPGAENVSLSELMTWEQAPTNARRLTKAGATIALTTSRLQRRVDFLPNVRKAVAMGLTEEQALAALTTTPARLLGLEGVLGTIEPGKAANLVVVKGSIFDKEAKIRDTWINGRRHEVSKDPAVQLVGKGTLVTSNGATAAVDIDSVGSSMTVTLEGNRKVAAKRAAFLHDRLTGVIEGSPFGVEGYVTLSGVIDGGELVGSALLPDGSRIGFTIQDVKEDATPRRRRAAGGAAGAPGGGRGGGGGGAQEPAERKPDALTGTWEAMLTGQPPLPPEGVAFTLSLRLAEDQSVTGKTNVPSMAHESAISAGSFKAASGEVTLTVQTPHGLPMPMTAKVEGETMTGTATAGNLNGTFTATRTSTDAPEEETITEMPPEELPIPFGEYGLLKGLEKQDVLLENATIWTSGPEGIIQNGSMLVVNGKVEGVYRNAPAGSNAMRIDMQGKHITPGLIDCHSHTGIDGGVNEGSQANTAEVRIGDVIDPDDIGWYRELAGGLTVVNQLHGSANPIGGQNSVVKIRWGSPLESFRIAGAIEGIKFALGENVKRSEGRYPNTRMGVETMIRDAFSAARDYKQAWDRHLGLSESERSRTMPPRRDLELDALVEILEHTRLVHCHSYRQDEILMLIRVADEFGFKVGTFQHVLEGYKVAEAIATHGGGASSFTDWWAYKIEVMDAIPFNGALLHKAGVLTSFNSDSNELARRMNTEASKAVRYGGLEPAEALKFVTIFPAKQLRIDARVGSLEKGKDADFAVWSGDPLSTYSRCEQTWIEGVKVFDLERDRELRTWASEQRLRLIQKVLAEAHGKPTPPKAEAKPAEKVAEASEEAAPEVER